MFELKDHSVWPETLIRFLQPLWSRFLEGMVADCEPRERRYSATVFLGMGFGHKPLVSFRRKVH